MRAFDAAADAGADAGTDSAAMRAFLVRDTMGFSDWRIASALALDAAVRAGGTYGSCADVGKGACTDIGISGNCGFGNCSIGIW